MAFIPEPAFTPLEALLLLSISPEDFAFHHSNLCPVPILSPPDQMQFLAQEKWCTRRTGMNPWVNTGIVSQVEHHWVMHPSAPLFILRTYMWMPRTLSSILSLIHSAADEWHCSVPKLLNKIFWKICIYMYIYQCIMWMDMYIMGKHI